MFMTAEEINRSITWLVRNSSPVVKYLTHKHILKSDPQSEPMAELWKAVENCSDVLNIFSMQNEDGSWFSGGPWGPRGYRRQTGRGYTISRPKFVTTAWILPFLGEMGFTFSDVRIQRSCQYMLREMSFNTPHPISGPAAVNCCGLDAVPLRALASVGMASDERLRTGWEWINGCQRADGGWLNPNHLVDSPTPSTTQGRWPWDRSCAWGSFFAIQALFFSANEAYRSSLQAALEFMLWHLSKKDLDHIQTWVYHGHNIVKELLMFSEAGFDMNVQPISALLNWLKGYYRPEEGSFRTQEKPIPNFTRHITAVRKDFEHRYGPDYWDLISKTSAPVMRYHLFHLIEDDWLTYYLTRIGLNGQRS